MLARSDTRNTRHATAPPIKSSATMTSRTRLPRVSAIIIMPAMLPEARRAVAITPPGRLVAERYMPGYTRDTRLLSWSMAKSVTQALAGIAVRRGLIDIDKPMGDPRWAAGDPRAAIPWRWWLNMVDGQD